MQSLASVSDEDLLKQLHTSCAIGRRATARTLWFLAEVEGRRLYCAIACSSLYDFCIRHLLMSEGQAFRNVAVSRLVRRFPFILERIERGETHVSTLTIMAPYLTETNVEELMEITRGKRRVVVEAILAERFGYTRPKQASPYTLAVDEELIELLQWARDHFSNSIPDADVTKLTKRVFSELKSRIEKERREELARPAPEAPAHPTKSIPAAQRRYVEARDAGQCTYVDSKTGARCPAKAFTQFDHVGGRGLGHGSENLRLACRAHNLWFAELRYGKEYVAKRIRRAREERRQRRERRKQLKTAKPEAPT